MNRKMISLPNSPDTFFKGATPHNGNKAKGNRDVTARLTGSVIHHAATHAVMAAVILAVSGIPAGAGKQAISKNKVGPEKRAIERRFIMRADKTAPKKPRFLRNKKRPFLKFNFRQDLHNLQV